MNREGDPIIPKEYYEQLCRMGKENLCQGKYVEGMGYILPEIVVTPVKVGNYETFYNLNISNTIVVKNSPDTVPLFIFERKFKTVYNHHVNAIAKKGKPVYLTYDSNEKNRRDRRKAATSPYPTIPGAERDEYPYATTIEGGVGASIEYVNPTDNQRHGKYISTIRQAYNMKTGDVFHIILVPDNRNPKKEPIGEPVYSPVPERRNVPSFSPAPIQNPIETKDILTWGSVLAALAMLGKVLDVISSRVIIIIMPLDPSFYQHQYLIEGNDTPPIA